MHSPEPPRDPHAPLPSDLLLVLGLFVAGGPLLVDTFLPALPEIAAHFGATAAAVQATMAAVLAGLAVGQLVGGSSSDLLGRRPVLLAGLGLGLIASVAAVAAPSLGWLVVLRFCQGIGISAGIVVTRAIVADLVTGRAAARSLAVVQAIATITPIVAPVAGVLIIAAFGWRAILVAIAVMVGLGLVAAVLKAPETLPREHRNPGRRRIQRVTILAGLRSGRYPVLVLAHAMTFGVLMAYLSAAPFLFKDVLATSSGLYGVATALVMTVHGAGGFAVARFLRRRTVHEAARRGYVILVGASVLALAAALSPLSPWLIVPPAAVSLFGVGMLFGPVSALAIDSVRAAAGLGAAALGASQYAFAAIVPPLTGLRGPDDPLPFTVVMVICATLATLLYTLSRRLGHSSWPE